MRLIARSGISAVPFPKEYADTVIADMMRNPPPGIVPSLSAKDFPAVFPVWNDIAVDNKGYLWVSIGYWARRNHYFEVFSPDGAYLGPVISRFEYFRTASWNGDRVAITTYDRNRLPVVRMFRIDRPEPAVSVAQSPAVAPVAAVRAVPPTPFSWGDTRNVCALYDVAVRFVVPDSTKPLVIADSNSMGVTQFAFHAWTGLGPSKADSGIPWSDSTITMMNAANRPRADLPSCVRERPGVITESYDQLMAPFKDREKGWDLFYGAHPGSPGFLVFSRPLWLTDDHDEALVYVAHATHWLSGQGRVLYMRRVGGTWTVVKSRTHWVS